MKKLLSVIFSITILVTAVFTVPMTSVAASSISNMYTSAQYSGYTVNGPTLSHTADGSGAIKIGATGNFLLPMPFP